MPYGTPRGDWALPSILSYGVRTFLDGQGTPERRDHGPASKANHRGNGGQNPALGQKPKQTPFFTAKYAKNSKIQKAFIISTD